MESHARNTLLVASPNSIRGLRVGVKPEYERNRQPVSQCCHSATKVAPILPRAMQVYHREEFSSLIVYSVDGVIRGLKVALGPDEGQLLMMSRRHGCEGHVTQILDQT